MTERNFTFDGHTAFDLDSLPVTKLARVLRQLGEKGDFARVLKAKQIALIEQRHPVERQAAALLAIGENPDVLRLSDATPAAANAIGAVMRRGTPKPADDPPAVAVALPDLDALAKTLAQLLAAREPRIDRAAMAQIVRAELAAQLRQLAERLENAD